MGRKQHFVIQVTFAMLMAWSMNGFASDVSDCGNHPKASALVQLILKHSDQKRLNVLCDARLREIATAKAKAIIETGEFWHNAGHMTPNQWLRENGYPLSGIYPLFGNQVEIIAGGEDTAEKTLESFLQSSPHRTLMLGEDDFFEPQVHIGAAYLKQPGSDYIHHWVVMMADEHRLKQSSAFEFVFLKPVKTKPSKKRKESIRERMHRKRVKRTLHPDH